MNCHQFNENLSAFIDNELSSDLTNTIKAHLIRCPECRQKRDRTEDFGRRIRFMTPLTAPADFQFRIYAGIRKLEAKQTYRFVWRWQTIAVPAACLFLGILLGVSSDTFFRFPGKSDAVDAMKADQIEQYAAVTEYDEIYDYHLGRFARASMIPVSVDMIPDEPESFTRERRFLPSGSESSTMSAPRYVLDNIPMRVNYERTIY